MSTRLVATLGVCLAVALAAEGAAGRATRIPGDVVQLGTPSSPVFVVTVRAQPAPQLQQHETVAPLSSHCRATHEARTEIQGGRTRAILEEEGAFVRTGSTAFAGIRTGRQAPCLSLAALRARLERGEPTEAGTEFTVERKGGALVVRIDEKLSAAEAGKRGLFAVPLERVRAYDIERATGSPSKLRIRSYSFGRRFGSRRLVEAVEHYDVGYAGPMRPPTSVHTLFYELRSAGGQSSALAGGPHPKGEIQVGSQPTREATAEQTVEYFRNAHRRFRWPRYAVRLANGERAVVYPNLTEGRRSISSFVVVTRQTLVSVTGRFALSAVRPTARRLRPLTPG